MTPTTRFRMALAMAIVLGSIETIPLTVLQERGARSWALDMMDWAVWTVFVIEFEFILCVAPRVQIRGTTGDTVQMLAKILTPIFGAFCKQAE